MKLRDLIKDYLVQARLMQVATVSDNQPWTCSVYFSFDQDLNLYWLSLPETRHSQEIYSNPKVAGAIVLPQQPEGSLRGLQFEGDAFELSDKIQIQRGLACYSDRFSLEADRVNKILDDTDGHRLYQIKPRQFVLFDTKNYPQNPRQEYLL